MHAATHVVHSLYEERLPILTRTFLNTGMSLILFAYILCMQICWCFKFWRATSWGIEGRRPTDAFRQSDWVASIETAAAYRPLLPWALYSRDGILTDG